MPGGANASGRGEGFQTAFSPPMKTGSALPPECPFTGAALETERRPGAGVVPGHRESPKNVTAAPRDPERDQRARCRASGGERRHLASRRHQRAITRWKPRTSFSRGASCSARTRRPMAAAQESRFRTHDRRRIAPALNLGVSGRRILSKTNSHYVFVLLYEAQSNCDLAIGGVMADHKVSLRPGLTFIAGLALLALLECDQFARADFVPGRVSGSKFGSRKDTLQVQSADTTVTRSVVTKGEDKKMHYKVSVDPGTYTVVFHDKRKKCVWTGTFTAEEDDKEVDLVLEKRDD